MNVEVIWDVEIKAPNRTWRLGIMSECEIEKSVKNLANRATIIVPEYQMNQLIDFEDVIQRGDAVRIRLGYKGLIFKDEFNGYIREINSNGGNLTIECEDGLFLFRKDIKNKQFTKVNMRQIAQYIIDEVGGNFTLDCEYGIVYEKFTIYKATAYDVLKKLKEETGADIYFENNVLHIHQAYTRKTGEVDYSPQQNIEKFNLEYKTAIDRKVEVTIERIGLDGKVQSHTVGQPGGEKISKKVGAMDLDSVKMMAETEYKTLMSDGYKGDFDAWLFPFVEPAMTVGIYDEDYPKRYGRYYVDAVTTKFSESGIVRNVQLGIKLSA